jgi:hypothetical protein
MTFIQRGSTLPAFTVEVARTTTRKDVYTIDVSASSPDDAIEAAKALVSAEDPDPKVAYYEWERDSNIVDDDYQFTVAEMKISAGG